MAHGDDAASTHPLAYVRRRHGWSYQDLARVIADHAKALGVPMAARREKVWRWEHWGVVPEADSQRALARALGIPARELETRPWPRWLPAHGGMPDGLPWTVEGSRAALSALVDDATADPRGFPIADGPALLDAIADWDAAEAEGAAAQVAVAAGLASGLGAATGIVSGGPAAPGASRPEVGEAAPVATGPSGVVTGSQTAAAPGMSARTYGGALPDGSVRREPARGDGTVTGRPVGGRPPVGGGETGGRDIGGRVPAQGAQPAGGQLGPAPRTAAGTLDGPVVEWLEAGVLGLRRLDDRLGGAAVRHRVEADLRLVCGLLARGAHSPPVERRLLRVAADLAQLGGWAATDTGRHGAAQRHYLTGLRLAHSCGDGALAVALWGGLALQAVIAGRPQDAQAAAEAAVRAAGGTAPQVRALAASRLGRAHAAAGVLGPFRRAAAEAERQLDLARTDPGPAWLYWFDEAELAAQSGLALLDLGQAYEARPLLEQALAVQDPAFVRDRAVYSARAGQARAMTGDPEGARALAREAAALSRVCGTPRLTAALDALRSRLP
ncbi:hypothetical protein V2S66_10155 [Streptomyces sp. V4-01]|uniref:Transcriptional regulator n=1 Tax=Actinacidiphila polyblastidii TaxID=3110430 RepID=A0ABU7PAP4_9ACTN|nr:hypothetical protein [Streptomyces sp. V4-01]